MRAGATRIRSGSAVAVHRLEHLDVDGDELGLVLPLVDPGLDDHDGVVVELVAVVGHGLREHHDLDRVWRSSRVNTAMRSPFLVHLRWSLVMTPPKS